MFKNGDILLLLYSNVQAQQIGSVVYVVHGYRSSWTVCVMTNPKIAYLDMAVGQNPGT